MKRGEMAAMRIRRHRDKGNAYNLAPFARFMMMSFQGGVRDLLTLGELVWKKRAMGMRL